MTWSFFIIIRYLPASFLSTAQLITIIIHNYKNNNEIIIVYVSIMFNTQQCWTQRRVHV